MLGETGVRIMTLFPQCKSGRGYCFGTDRAARGILEDRHPVSNVDHMRPVNERVASDPEGVAPSDSPTTMAESAIWSGSSPSRLAGHTRREQQGEQAEQTGRHGSWGTGSSGALMPGSRHERAWRVGYPAQARTFVNTSAGSCACPVRRSGPTIRFTLLFVSSIWR